MFTRCAIGWACLPNPDFKDENVEATGVGIGIEREQKGCKTNEKGPEMFTRCAIGWVNEEDREEFLVASDSRRNRLLHKYNNFCDRDMPPPISKDPKCEAFHTKLSDLKQKSEENNGILPKQEAEFVAKYSLSKETLLLPLSNLTLKLIKENRTHCFSTEIGYFSFILFWLENAANRSL